MSETHGQTPGFAIAIETSGRIGSIALGCGNKFIEQREFGIARNHAVELLPTMKRLCAAHNVKPDQLQYVYVSGGPGSFTGLRVGVVCARMLALAVGAQTVCVPTLEVVCQNALQAHPRPQHVMVMLDAKRKRVFATYFKLIHESYVPIDEPAEVDPEDYVALLPHGTAIMGEGVTFHNALSRQHETPSSRHEASLDCDCCSATDDHHYTILPESLYQPQAQTVYRLGYERACKGDIIPANELIPIYVRRPEAEEVWEKRHVQ